MIPTNSIFRATQLQLTTAQAMHLKTKLSTHMSTVILQQFSMITQEFKNCMYKVSGGITKIAQACTTGQGNTINQ